MGVLNATPDSFSDGGEFNTTGKALKRIETMVSEGASIIDIGGESTRPGAEPVPEEEELRRVIPLLEQAVPEFPETFFSIDTTKFRVAGEALDRGVAIVNDISGMQKEPRLADLCSEYGSGYILMHSRGDPKFMQQDPSYEDVIVEITGFFKRQSALAKKRGVEHILLDPGIGFGKSLEHNLKILAGLDKFVELGYPLMVGVSRKSMIGKLLNGRSVEDRLAGTICLHYHALTRGARIIRVHDVKEAYDSVLIYNALTNAGKRIADS